MSTKAEQLQDAWHQYERENEHLPSGTMQVVQWAVAKGLVELPEIDPYDVLAGQMAGALRQEYKTDDKGRRYRVNHAVKITKDGVQHTFWGIMGYAPHDHMQRAFSWRREQIIDDCSQLKTDVDVYNDLNEGKAPKVQMVLDFTEDVAEREAARQPGPELEPVLV
jgi:hypothetical protein